jgi:hypothetical protein
MWPQVRPPTTAILGIFLTVISTTPNDFFEPTNDLLGSQIKA